jgi:hypothetical protein
MKLKTRFNTVLLTAIVLSCIAGETCVDILSSDRGIEGTRFAEVNDVCNSNTSLETLGNLRDSGFVIITAVVFFFKFSFHTLTTKPLTLLYIEWRLTCAAINGLLPPKSHSQKY